MSNSLLRLQVRIQQACADLRDERGQSMVEYAGVALIASALVFAVIGLMNGNGEGIASSIVDRIQQAIDDLG